MKTALLLALALAGLPAIAAAQAPRLELRNDAVTVLRIHLAPHEKTPAHDVTPRVVVWLTDAHLLLTFPDGTTRREDHHAGEVAWVPAMRHTGENVGDRAIEFIAVVPNREAARGDR